MTAVLAKAARQVDIPDVPGISGRAIRRVLSCMAQVAQTDGTFRYGMRGSKVAELADFSLAVVRRAQRVLVDAGFLERVEVGGGRKSTHWRVVVAKLLDLIPTPQGHTTAAPATQQPAPQDTGQERTQESRRRFVPWSRRDAESRPAAPTYPKPIDEVCEEHGSTAGILPSGLPRCPGCRHALDRLRA